MSHNESVQVGVISCVELLCTWKQKLVLSICSKHIKTGFEESKVPVQLLDPANTVQNILEIHRMTAGAAHFLFCIEVAARRCLQPNELLPTTNQRPVARK